MCWVKTCVLTSTVGVGQDASLGVIVKLMGQVKHAGQSTWWFMTPTQSFWLRFSSLQLEWDLGTQHWSNLWCSRPGRGSSQHFDGPLNVPQRKRGTFEASKQTSANICHWIFTRTRCGSWVYQLSMHCPIATWRLCGCSSGRYPRNPTSGEHAQLVGVCWRRLERHAARGYRCSHTQALWGEGGWASQIPQLQKPEDTVSESCAKKLFQPCQTLKVKVCHSQLYPH